MAFTSTLMKFAGMAIAKFIGSNASLIIVKDGTQTAFPIQFNPSEYKISNRANFNQQERVRKSEPVVNYGGTSMSTLNVRLHFNDDEPVSISSAASGVIDSLLGKQSMSIEKKVSLLSALTAIDGDAHQPPQVLFAWGSTLFGGVATNVVSAYTMFDKSGKALRATVDLTIMGQCQVQDERASPLMSPDRTKAQILTEDSSIFSIAEREYGDAREWRRIADANDITNPLEIPVGRVLKVPSINE